MVVSVAEKQNHQSNPDLVRQALSAAQYLSDLPAPVLQDLAEFSEVRSFKAGETVFTISQYDCAELFCLIDGSAKLTTISVQTDTLSVIEMSAGDIFGLEYALSKGQGKRFQAGMTASTDLSVLTIDADHVRDVVKRKPVVARSFLAAFASQLLQLSAGQTDQPRDPQKRIFRSLLDLARPDNAEGSNLWRIDQMPKHRDLGESAGTSEVEAAEAVARLISQGIAKRDYPGLLITDYVTFQLLTF